MVGVSGGSRTSSSRAGEGAAAGCGEGSGAGGAWATCISSSPSVTHSIPWPSPGKGSIIPPGRRGSKPCYRRGLRDAPGSPRMRNSPLVLSLLFGLAAAAANVLGGLVVVMRRHWNEMFLKYFVGLGAGFMLAATFLK